ncbi:Beta-galactosidase [Lacunisphaera limnophila]|uniref:Beta-galactosidase n=1 Tax=Lacunisphaera limnophila TaxID=1838286 RepID=A0A1D8AUN4_9BACT|nr:beta-galactosidase GalA [Lacunisphaera limnophila]AOS44585.1 Beta-galactosidase [Lacunisphaera limnophila]
MIFLSPAPYRLFIATCLLFALALASMQAEPAAPPREKIRLDAGWRFALGHASDPARDFGHGTGYFSYLAKTGFGDGPASIAFDDRGWRQIDLPHDWAVELPFDRRGKASHGYRPIGAAFPETSVGWYRRTFPIAASDLGRRISLEFDGIYRNARVFVNGFLVGEEPSGYLGTSYDVSEYLNYGGDNVIAVRADATIEEGWFYEGAGIYRHVWLTKTAPWHVAREGTFVRTDVAGPEATVTVDTQVVNEGHEAASGTLEQEVVAPDGRVLATNRRPLQLAAGETTTLTDAIAVASPQLWSLETPVRHTLVTTLRRADQIVDRYETPFGIRTLRFDPNAGFFLNGRRVELKGTNNHQDHAGVGAAIPDALQEFRLRKLKEFGSNAYRCSHNPPTPELLDACDRLGLLVIDENRLMGINAWHLHPLERLIRRDRNHPSVIMWSIGNEEWAIEGNIKGARITLPMQNFAHRLDPTRPVSAAISGGWGGISRTVQALGVNYIRQGDTDRQHTGFPGQIILGTEETTNQQTRGIYVTDQARGHLAPQEDGTSGGNAELGWKHYAARPWAAGVFFWTGFDYRGEPTPFGFPAVSSQFGILDTCGFPKDGTSYLKAWWTDEPVLHIFPHWNWSGREGQEIEVRAHSNCEEVELFLNGATLGRKKMEPNGHLAWPVRYAPGMLVAQGYRPGQETLTTKVETTGPAAAVVLVPDRPAIKADGRDVAVVTVEIRDAAGRLVPTAGDLVGFTISGPGRIIGVGNGDPSSLEADQFVGSSRSVTLGEWAAPNPAVNTGEVTFETTFDLPPPADGETYSLLLNTLGPRQTAELNGEILYRDADPAHSRVELANTGGKLKPAGNKLRLVSPVYPEWRDREGLAQFHPLSLRIQQAAPPWQRAAFNGLAQVIVQSTGEPGVITLRAASAHLPAAVTDVTAN